ncbi:MAG TPA: DUF2975 domain-containing protein [Gammaproteobacteria bacterium]|nr:DUF2975 domain-containing protein [Gammaproteobacteria bacterium]
MRPETEARIRTVQKFGKNARQFCALAATMLGIGLFANWAKIAVASGFEGWGGAAIQLGAYHSVSADQLASVADKMWAFAWVTVAFGVLFWTLFHLYRLFKQLEAGSIYTKQNVYHLRQVGWLSMALAVFQMIMPAASLWLAQMGLIDSTLVTVAASGSGPTLFIGQSLGGLITASLILLASWIMDVGREVSDDAAAMHREAELVI